jgi:hypothetical protein
MADNKIGPAPKRDKRPFDGDIEMQGVNHNPRGEIDVEHQADSQR